MWDLGSLQALNKKRQETPTIAEAAATLLRAFEEARQTDRDVSFCRGVMSLKSRSDKDAMRAILNFLYVHGNPSDMGYQVVPWNPGPPIGGGL